MKWFIVAGKEGGRVFVVLQACKLVVQFIMVRKCGKCFCRLLLGVGLVTIMVAAIAYLARVWLLFSIVAIVSISFLFVAF